ncbi:hypothetical protein HY572_01850 [Candidatus Micrarchaeota archaeon]|nr:hypothetical protein [Candidatus Micrarchaeota archaeon]
MKFKRKPCGICNTPLHEFKDEVTEGIHVDAYRCKQGHASYSRSVMEKVESIQKATPPKKGIY